MSLKDKTIVVSGGSRGLGLGLVEALVGQGARPRSQLWSRGSASPTGPNKSSEPPVCT
jgi:hypothetical protein